jgi:DNA segregation ATPase FtsK/SpoIIIE-like protein
LAAAARGRVGSVLLLLRRPAEAVAEFRATLATRVIEAKPDSTLAVLLRIGLADALREIERDKDTLPAVSAERGALEDALRSATMTPLSSIKVFEDARVRLVALEALLRLYNRASLFAEAVQRVWFHCGVELEAPDSLEFVHVLEELAHALAGLKLRAESAHTLRRAVHVMLAAGIDDADRQAALIERACDLLCELGLKDEALELALRLWPTPENQARNRAALKSNVLQPPQPEESVARADPTTARRAYYKARASLALPPQLQSRPPKPPKRQPQPLPPPPQQQQQQQQQQQLLLATAADD